MRTLLISPPMTTFEGKLRTGSPGTFPLGLGYLAGALRRAGHAALICAPDVTHTPLEATWAAAEQFRPDLVGITSVTPNFMTARRLAAEARRRLGRPVIMGGPHPSALPESTLRGLPELDAVIAGEGEGPLLALAEAFDRTGRFDFARLPGAAVLEEGRFKQNPPGEPIADLDSLPEPALDLLHNGAWARHPAGGSVDKAFLISSRGCPGKCTFCVNSRFGRRFRARSPEHFVAEVEMHVRRYGTRRLSFVDDCFTADQERAARVCELLIKKRLGVVWEAAGRVNTLTDEGFIRLLRRAGCVILTLGIETASPRLSALMRKQTTPEQAVRCCALLRRYGIAFFASFMLGNEGETRETALESIDFAIRLKPSMPAFNITVPFPGTDLFDRFYADFDRPDTDWTHWDADGEARPCQPRQTALTNRELRRLQLRANLCYYANPLRVLRMVADLNATYR